MLSDIDFRIPEDRMNDTRVNEHYAHVITGFCEKHQMTALRCVHTMQEDNTTTTEVMCLACYWEENPSEE